MESLEAALRRSGSGTVMRVYISELLSSVVRAPGHLEGAGPGHCHVDSTAACWPVAAAPSFCSHLITMENRWLFRIDVDAPTFLG